MTQANKTVTKEAEARLAGVVRATCRCCATAEVLVPHLSLGGTRLACPSTRQTYLDRGDGVYEPDGECLDAAAGPAQARTASPLPSDDTGASADVTSDRPVRTGPKTRIDLERATFAARS
jgi:hypothetical protein